MAVSMSPKQKVYQGILQEIRKFIDENNLKTGDKLPSERVLSEKLNAGRSSVREALRAMELLGLIETKRGEGTFLSSYRPFQTVEVLASFILQETGTKNDLLFVNRILEKEAAKLVFHRMNGTILKNLTRIISDTELQDQKKHIIFFTQLFEATENLLLTKIWKLTEEYLQTITNSYDTNSFYEKLILLYEQQDFDSIEVLFESSSEFQSSYFAE